MLNANKKQEIRTSTLLNKIDAGFHARAEIAFKTLICLEELDVDGHRLEELAYEAALGNEIFAFGEAKEIMKRINAHPRCAKYVN